MPEPTPRKPLFNPDSRRRGIYVLPSLFTTAALFSGFYAIIQAMQGNFEVAAIAVFIAMVMDGLDGRIARLTHTQSAFGAEYDSLSDMVSFGVAPALIVYTWALSGLGRIGWLAAFIYCVGAALRLARFNTTIGVMDKRYFQGLPSPAAAAFVVGLVWLAHDMGITQEDMRWMSWLAAFVTILAGVTMVSNILFYSFKDINLKKRVPFMTIVALVLALVLIPSINTAGFLFGFFLLYLLSGYLLATMRFFSRKRICKSAPPLPGDKAENAPSSDTEKS
ncbi:MAG: CDP-diacylglycerol--serine O-phosphatidyltransferase [Betaproteobacteria bacterium]|nr:CDP-diacylglycerol--serine O-phosphatidyltransferase [Betaproteobacteria bacterium]